MGEKRSELREFYETTTSVRSLDGLKGSGGVGSDSMEAMAEADSVCAPFDTPEASPHG